MQRHDKLLLPDEDTDGMGALVWGLAAVCFFAVVGFCVVVRSLVGWLG